MSLPEEFELQLCNMGDSKAYQHNFSLVNASCFSRKAHTFAISNGEKETGRPSVQNFQYVGKIKRRKEAEQLQQSASYVQL